MGKRTTKENTQILKILESSRDVHKAVLDNIDIILPRYRV